VDHKTFRGGIHPSYNKELTARKAIEDISLPAEVVIPLAQHVGAPNDPIVKVGDRVEAGQKIGATDAFISAPVHSSVSGTVKAIEGRPNFTGKMVNSIVITVDSRQPGFIAAARDVSSLSAEQIREVAKEAGLVGLGGATFPTQVKLNPPRESKIDTVIINGCECEPYLTCDHRLMLERGEDLIAGLRLMMRAVGAEKGLLGVEANKMDAVESLSAMVAAQQDIEVVVLEVKYPEGAEKMLIDAVTGRRVPPGKLPSEVGVLVQNVQTAVALYDAASTGKPVIERVLTITGPGVKKPGNLRVKVGTPISHVIEQRGGMSPDTVRVVMGGPMTGFAQDDLSVPVVKSTSGILLLDSATVAAGEELQCVSCDRCLEVCPMFLMPNSIVKFARRGKWDLAEKYGAKDCFECGACAYVCPARIPHIAYVRKAKAELAAAAKSK